MINECEALDGTEIINFLKHNNIKGKVVPVLN
jgi:hypothetical protein